MDPVREAAKAEIRHRKWASLRGKATRAFIREHPELVVQFKKTGTVKVKSFPANVTKASVILELNQRARRRENTLSARKWAEEHPAEAAKIAEEVRTKMQSEEQADV